MDLPRLSAEDIVALAAQRRRAPRCACRTLQRAGWESFPAGFDETLLAPRGRIGAPGSDDACSGATLAEHHPQGTHYGSPGAPIALGHFPYNRCEVWACTRCACAFLRYTEYGGYYVDRRIRLLDASLVVDSMPPCEA